MIEQKQEEQKVEKKLTARERIQRRELANRVPLHEQARNRFPNVILKDKSLHAYWAIQGEDEEQCKRAGYWNPSENEVDVIMGSMQYQVGTDGAKIPVIDAGGGEKHVLLVCPKDQYDQDQIDAAKANEDRLVSTYVHGRDQMVNPYVVNENDGLRIDRGEGAGGTFVPGTKERS